jgi:hypothetical protein
LFGEFQVFAHLGPSALCLIKERPCSGLPEGPQNETDRRGARQRCHGLVVQRVFDSVLEIPGHLLHALTRLWLVFSKAIGHVLGLIGNSAELIACFFF